MTNVQQVSFSETSLTLKGYRHLLEMPNLKKVIFKGYNPPIDIINQLKDKDIEVLLSAI